MKKIFLVCLLLGSIAAKAEGSKRLTTTSCTNEELETTMILKWDSSVSIIGPVSVEINDELVDPVIISYEDSTGVQGSLKNGEKYSTTIHNDETSRSLLKIGDEKIDIDCSSETSVIDL